MTSRPFDIPLTEKFHRPVVIDLGCSPFGKYESSSSSSATSSAATVLVLAGEDNKEEEGEVVGHGDNGGGGGGAFNEPLLDRSVSDDQCTLLYPFAPVQFSSHLWTNRFANSTITAGKSNFVTSYLGPHHYVTVKPDTTSTSTSTTTTTTTTASGGAECVIIDTDGIYYSRACSYIGKDFLKFAVSTFNVNHNQSTAGDYVGHLESTTNWHGTAGNMDLTFRSLFNASYSNVGSATGTLDFSLANANMSFDMSAFNDNNVQVMTEVCVLV